MPQQCKSNKQVSQFSSPWLCVGELATHCNQIDGSLPVAVIVVNNACASIALIALSGASREISLVIRKTERENARKCHEMPT